jgi:hypothetical protein
MKKIFLIMFMLCIVVTSYAQDENLEQYGTSINYAVGTNNEGKCIINISIENTSKNTSDRRKAEIGLIKFIATMIKAQDSTDELYTSLQQYSLDVSEYNLDVADTTFSSEITVVSGIKNTSCAVISKDIALYLESLIYK